MHVFVNRGAYLLPICVLIDSLNINVLFWASTDAMGLGKDWELVGLPGRPEHHMVNVQQLELRMTGRGLIAILP